MVHRTHICQSPELRNAFHSCSAHVGHGWAQRIICSTTLKVNTIAINATVGKVLCFTELNKSNYFLVIYDHTSAININVFRFSTHLFLVSCSISKLKCRFFSARENTSYSTYWLHIYSGYEETWSNCQCNYLCGLKLSMVVFRFPMLFSIS